MPSSSKRSTAPRTEPLPRAFSFETFVKNLGPVKGGPVVEWVCGQFAVDPAPDLHAFLSRHPPAPASLTLKELGLWQPNFAEMRAGAWSKGLAFEQGNWREIIQALTGTVVVGVDGSGDPFLVEVHPERSTVFRWADGAVEYLASSFSTFVELNHLTQECLTYCEAHELEPDGISRKEIAASPTLTFLAERATDLSDRIQLGEARAYRELLPGLAKKQWKSKSPVIALADRARWLMLLTLHHGDLGKAQVKRPLPIAKPLAGLAPSRVHQLAETWVFAPDEFALLAKAAKTDEAQSVRLAAVDLPKFQGWKPH